MATGWIIEKTVDLAKPPRNFRLEQPYEIFYVGDNDSATWRVHVERNGEPVTLNGNVSVYVKRPDGMIVFTEEVLQSGNICEVDIGYPDFIVPGYVQAVMRYTDSTSHATVTLDAFACVIQSDPAGGTIIDKDGILPETLEQLLEQIQEMQKATEAAQAAAECIADEYSSSNTYAIGEYVLYDNGLYRCTTAIVSPETWTAAHWTQVVFGDEVSELKNAVLDIGLVSINGKLCVRVERSE